MTRRRFFGDDFGPLNANELDIVGPTGPDVQGIMDEWINTYDGSNNKNFTSSGLANNIQLGVLRIDDRRALFVHRPNGSNPTTVTIGDFDPITGNITLGSDNAITSDAGYTPATDLLGVPIFRHDGAEFLIFLLNSAGTEMRLYSIVIGSGTTIASITLVQTFAGSIFDFNGPSTASVLVRKHSASRYVMSTYNRNAVTAPGTIKLTYFTYSGGVFTQIQTLTYGTASGAHAHRAYHAVEDENSGYFFSQASGPDQTRCFKYTLSAGAITAGTNIASWVRVNAPDTSPADPHLLRVGLNKCKLQFNTSSTIHGDLHMVDFRTTPVATKWDANPSGINLEMGGQGNGIANEMTLVQTAPTFFGAGLRMQNGFMHLPHGLGIANVQQNNGVDISATSNSLYPVLNSFGAPFYDGTPVSGMAYNGANMSAVFLTKDILLVVASATASFDMNYALIRRV